MEQSALVIDVETFALHDGPGIRSVVFLKGCPLHCPWCHNPESQSFEPEIMFQAEKCIGCGKCVSACPQLCHRLESGKHIFDRTHCSGCGKCAGTCYAEALALAGKRMTVSEVMEAVLKDRAFYEKSGGGLTISGGEPLAHPDFTLALLEAAKKNALHTAVETSGFAPWQTVDRLRPLVDLWLWDAKAAAGHHEELTGVPAGGIHANLRRLDESGAKIVLRCPLVPGINDLDTDLGTIAELANSLQHVAGIDLEPYHPLGESKRLRLGRPAGFHADFASGEQKQRWVDFLRERTAVPVCI